MSGKIKFPICFWYKSFKKSAELMEFLAQPHYSLILDHNGHCYGLYKANETIFALNPSNLYFSASNLSNRELILTLSDLPNYRKIRKALYPAKHYDNLDFNESALVVLEGFFERTATFFQWGQTLTVRGY